ncbi:MAG: 23S rRNA (uracil(1939)-C(5))-methyltransferase RlmD [Lachnospiraceae bacterium]|nr:23S rRNA (uracil(1939)-C(5))-methyltransferase RlmD [Lachnospiraceae bacterium]
MKKGNLYEGKVVMSAFPNKGIVHVDGEKVIVKNALPGQTVSFILSKNKTGSKEGRLVEVLERSDIEDMSSACSVFGKCGGCIYQTLPYEEELKIKESQIRTLFENFLRSEPEYAGVSSDSFLEEIRPSPVYAGYRNKMEYSFGDEVKGGDMTLGMHVAGHFNDIVNTDECNISDPDFEIIRKITLSFFRTEGMPFYHKNTGEGFLRHLLLRKGINTGEILVCIVTTSAFEAADIMKRFCEQLLSMHTSGNITGVVHIINDSPADAVKADRTVLLYGKDCFYDEVCGLRFRITPFSFFQTNTLGAQVLYSVVRRYVEEALGGGDGRTGTVFDLYCGTGTITQILSGVAKRAVGIEIVEEAVAAARENAQINGITNTEFIAGDVLKVLEGLDEKPDLIIMDPPREGATPKALAKILDYGVDSIIYVSCKPTSLMRDLALCTDAGYRIIKAAPVDMFPRTGNVETVVCLSKGDVKSKKIRVEFSLEDMDTDGFKKGATYNAIRDWIKEKYGYRVTNLNIAQVKQKHGIIERENYNKPKSPDSKQPGCPEEKIKAIEDAMRHFQMI